MRFTFALLFALLLVGIVSCGGNSEKLNSENTGKFTLSDAEIDAFEASPDVQALGEGGGGRLSAVPPILAQDVLDAGGASRSASVVVPGPGPGDGGGGDDDDECKPKPDKCKPCKDKCGKCTKKKGCSCNGKCQQKCGKCQGKCGKCGHDGNCGCKGKCKQPCGKCKPNCRKCRKDGNCGCTKCVCPPRCKVKCRSICSTGDTSFDMDCDTGCADVTYKVRLTFRDHPKLDSEALGHEVVFFRNGIEAGRATTDINGDAWLVDPCLEPGTYNIKAKYDKCVVCFDVCVNEIDCCEVKCTGITSSTAAQYEADCDTHCAEVTYNVKLAFNDCPDVDNEAQGHEVVFYRDGAEVGRGITDAGGQATFTEDCLPLGDYAVEAKFEDCQTGFSVNVWEDCCEVVCTGMDIQTERFILAECWNTKASVPLQVQLNFSDCPGKTFDKSGHGVTFRSQNGPIGAAVTDADGMASFTWANVPIGNHHVIVESAQACGTEFIVTVHEECRYHACIKGKGRLPSKNNDRYFIFSYEGHVQDGHLEQANWMSLSDGDISFTNLPIDWIIVLGAEIYFGSADGNIMFHTIDLGPAPGADIAEVWVFDRNYYNYGNLLNGQIRSSWGLKKPPANP